MPMQEKKDIELETFKDWKKSQSKSDFQKLYTSMKPLIYGAAKSAAYGSNIPEIAHRVYAAQAFLDALRTFDPKGGAALQTHVYGNVSKKVKRLNYEYQNLGKIPEPRAILVGRFQNELANKHNELGREPSAAEMSDHMGIPLKHITGLMKEIRKDLAIDRTSGTDEFSFSEQGKDEEFLSYLYYELTPEEKVVYEYMTGSYGRPKLERHGKLDIGAVVKNSGMSENKVKNLHLTIREKYRKIMKV